MIDERERVTPRPSPALDPAGHASHGAVERVDLLRIGMIALAAIAVWMRWWEPLGSVSIIGIAATLVGGYPIFKEALENIVERRMTMELSMTIALIAALSIGQTLTALIITAFVLAAEILEHLTVARGRAAIGDLVRFLPPTARVRRAGTVHEIRAAELCVGDAVLVNPGALIPVDGTVFAGASFVDEARITGEPRPAEKLPGTVVYAGTVNGNGALEITTERIGRDTSFGRIIEAVESAGNSQAPIERLADRLAGYLVYFALGAALLTYVLTRNIVATISVVIVAGACGIAAGTPLAVLGAIGRAARAGAIVKGGRYLEALARIDTVVFDKTGTLTFGAPEIVEIHAAPGVAADDLLTAAAIAETRSEHPLAAAILTTARSHGLANPEPQAFAYTPGRGIRAIFAGETIVVGNLALLHDFAVDTSVIQSRGERDDVAGDVHVARGARYLGSIAVTDAIRPEAAAAVAALRALGVRTVLLTGDSARAAQTVGRTVGVDEIVADALPETKTAYIARLVATGRTVVMIGDGINDAPALVQATVGVAMGSGTDVARESADIVLLGNDLSRFVETVQIARRARRIIMQNFVGTIAVDAIGILLAAIGVLNPLVAAFIHVASELAFILNATRLLVRPDSRRTGHQPV